MRKSYVIASVVFYFVAQAIIIVALAIEGRAENLTFLNLVRPLAILIFACLFKHEGGKWGFWLGIASGSALPGYLNDLPNSGLSILEAFSQLLIAVCSLWYWKGDPTKNYFRHSVLARLKAYFLPQPDMITISLDSHIEEIRKEYKFLSARDGDPWLIGCDHYVLNIRDQKITIAVDDNKVKGVIYDSDLYREAEAERVCKLRYFISSHSVGSKLKLIVNNGFGFLYRDQSDKIRASYSYCADIFSISYFGYEMKRGS